MAPNATIFKATLHIADMDRHYYEDHAVTLARHPSETDERMMVRLLAFARHAHDALIFGRGIGTEDEPALWQKDLTGAIELWIEVGEPEEKLIRQACGRATQVAVYSYGGRGADRWWEKTSLLLARCKNLTVINIPQDGSRALAQLAQRSMDLHCSIQDGQILIGDGTHAVQIELTTIHPVET
ncbi:MAG: hypothetical protein LZF86_80115 [Nitrospira sp.]|nr:MAG: hypothetical protein LZF86_80115 [Nitrospira sp.]